MKIEKGKLALMYRSMKTTDLAAELDISVPTLMKLIDSAGIIRKGKGNHYDREKIEVVG